MPPNKRSRFRKRSGGGDKNSSVETPPSHPVPNKPAAEPDIPVLKKKEKERRGAGAAGYAGTGGGSPGLGFNIGAGGARVGSSLVAQPGLLGSGKIAAMLANVFGGPSTFVGGLFAGKLGAPLVLGGMLAWGGVMAAAGLKMMGIDLSGTRSTAESVAFAPGAVDGSGIVIDKPKDRSLGYVANANQGEVLWDKEHPMAPKKAAGEDDTVDSPDAIEEEAPQFETPDVSALMEENAKKAGLDRESFVKKLSQSTGGGANGARLSNGTAGFTLAKSLQQKKPLTPAGIGKGSANAMKRANDKLNVRKMSTARGQSNRAMGQLKLARNMSASGAAASPDQTARQYSADAFDQTHTIGGELDGVGAGSGIVVPPGNGAPGGGVGSTPSDLAPPPSAGPGENVTPYQGNVDRARMNDNMAGQNTQMGMIMLIIGAILIGIGVALLFWPMTAVGLALIAAGAALLMMGMMMMQQGQEQGKAAKEEADQIEQEYGQEEQAGVIDDCADQAVADGTRASSCAPTQTTQDFNQQINQHTPSVQEAVKNEQDATYELEGEGEGGAPAP